MSSPAVRGVIFDKDGTLVDLHATWAPALAEAFDVTFADDDSAAVVADLLGFDLVAGVIRTDAMFATAGMAEIAATIEPHCDAVRFFAHVEAETLRTVREAPYATEVLESLGDIGVPMAMATNDNEGSARQQLAILGWSHHFVEIVGADSGHGTKPDAGVVHACVRALGVHPKNVVMVGDRMTDLDAARNAGVAFVLVGDRADLAPDADAVIADLRGVFGLIDASI